MTRDRGDPPHASRTSRTTTEVLMLVLGRKLNETIVIAGNIRITTVSIRGRCVRLAIDAPADVPIFREELLDSAATNHAERLASETLG
jgi:carbon storage regulator